jgi:glycosyltransferase involved in cell wall biosynthesis
MRVSRADAREPLFVDNRTMSARQGRRPHVLTLIDLVGPGGAERVAEEILFGLDPDRFRRSVCITRSTEDSPEEATKLSLARLRSVGVEVIPLARRSRWDLRPMQRLGSLLRSGDVDLVHAHKFGSNVWGAALGRLCRVPVVICHEHTWSFEGQLGRRLIDRNIVARFSDMVIAVSEADRRRMISIVGMPSERVTLIPNGIPEPHPRHPASVRADLGIAADAPLLVQTAVLRPQKAIGTMLEAMAFLRERQPTARLVIVGPGDPSARSALQTQAAELGVFDAVSFLGQRDGVPDILAAADVGVLSSDFEGMPLAILEYMAAGLPVVSTDVGGVPEIVHDGQTGLLVPRGDSRGLAEGIGRLIADPELAERMGQNGRRLQQERFSATSMIRATTALYDRLLAAAGISTPPPDGGSEPQLSRPSASAPA